MFLSSSCFLCCCKEDLTTNWNVQIKDPVMLCSNQFNNFYAYDRNTILSFQCYLLHFEEHYILVCAGFPDEVYTTFLQSHFMRQD